MTSTADKNDNYYKNMDGKENLTFAKKSLVGNIHFISTNDPEDQFTDHQDAGHSDFGPVSALEVARQLAGDDDLSDTDEPFVPMLPYSNCSAISREFSARSTAEDHNTNLHISSDIATTDFQQLKTCSSKEIFQDNDDDDDEDGASCLGSSVTCSETSFELARTEDFENLHSPLSNNNNNFCNTIVSAGSAISYAPARHISQLNNDDTPVNYRFSDSASSLIRIENEEKVEHRSNISNIKDNDSFNNASLGASLNLDLNDQAQNVISKVGCSNFAKNDAESAPVKFYDSTKVCNVDHNDVIILQNELCDKTAHLTNINDELAKLDTAMPQLNFDELERHLTDAAREREKTQREILSEEVRRRLALDYISENEDDEPYKSSISTNPKVRGNRAKLKAANMNIEICFVNDGLPSEEDEDCDNETEDCLSGVPKSLSTPNLGYGKSILDKKDNEVLERSLSNSGDSEKRASELRRDALARQALEETDLDTRKCRLERETKVMLTKAKQAAHMQMEIEKQSKLKRSKSVVEEIVGVTLGKRKLTRLQLSKMCITQLLIIINELHSRIQNFNEELVHLLIERDTLHMEQDSMLVDVQDLIQYQRKDDVKLPDFVAKLINLNANNGLLKKQFSFKMLKKVIPFSHTQTTGSKS